MKTEFRMLMLASALFVLPFTVHAQSMDPTVDQDRMAMHGACKGDVQALCPTVQKGQGRIIRCLKENNARLSPNCATSMKKMKTDRMARKSRGEGTPPSDGSLAPSGNTADPAGVTPPAGNTRNPAAPRD